MTPAPVLCLILPLAAAIHVPSRPELRSETLAGAWQITLTPANDTAATQRAIIYVLLADSSAAAEGGVALTGEHRTDLHSQFGWQPICVPIRGTVWAWRENTDVSLNFAPRAADCGLVLRGTMTTPDSVVGTWVLPSYAGEVPGGTFLMVRIERPLMRDPGQRRGFGLEPAHPIRLEGSEPQGRQRIERYLGRLREALDPEQAPEYRWVAVCCIPPAPFDAPLDVYEVRWTRRVSVTRRPGDLDSLVDTTLVDVDTFYFTRFPLPAQPEGYYWRRWHLLPN